MAVRVQQPVFVMKYVRNMLKRGRAQQKISSLTHPRVRLHHSTNIYCVNHVTLPKVNEQHFLPCQGNDAFGFGLTQYTWNSIHIPLQQKAHFHLHTLNFLSVDMYTFKNQFFHRKERTYMNQDFTTQAATRTHILLKLTLADVL